MQVNTGHNQNNQGGQQGNQSAKPSLSWSQPTTSQPNPAKAVPPVVTSAPSRVSTVSAETSYTGTYIGILVGGIIIGALIGWGITGSRGGGVATPTASSTAATTTGTSSSSTQNNTSGSVDLSGSTVSTGAFTVTSPQTAGFAVAVSNVMVSQPTWIVIYEDHAGAPGNALGAALFLPQSQGTAQSGTVELLRGTLPGQTYLAGETLDDGDKIFSLENDKPVRDAKGNPILAQFTTK